MMSVPKETYTDAPTKRNLDDWDKEYGIATNNTKRVCPDPLQPIFKPSDTSSTSSDNPFLKIAEHPISPIAEPSMDIPSQDWVTHYIQEENKELMKIHLGDNLFAILQIYKGELGFHIREYFQNPQGHLLPSKVGVRMDMPTFYKFCMKIFEISLAYCDESTIFNNTVLGLVENRQLRLVKFSPLGVFTKSVCLTQEQFVVLKNNIVEMEQCVMEYLFSERLAQLVSTEIPYHSETMDVAFIHLKSLVEANLLEHINDNFQCAACKSDSMSQYKHDCVNASPLEKLKSLTDSIRMLCDVNKIAEQFLLNNSKLSKQLNFMELCSRLFEM